MSDPFKVLTSKTLTLSQANIDTDQIIPARFLTTTTREGLGAHAFHDWRYEADGSPKPESVLNRIDPSEQRILLAGPNFACGSSREHAPWALMDFGISCVISTSFADIFYSNCFQNGLLPVVLKPEEVQDLMEEAKGGNHMVTVDLESQSVISPSGQKFTFQIDAQRKEKMLKGLDAIGETLQAAASIDVYEGKRAISQPWLERA